MPKALARLYHRIGQPERAMEVLQAHVQTHPAQVGMGGMGISYFLPSLVCLYGRAGGVPHVGWPAAPLMKRLEGWAS